MNGFDAEILEAERKAWQSLARYKFWMFGYWAGVWVHLNRIRGNVTGARKANPFVDLVRMAREKLAKNAFLVLFLVGAASTIPQDGRSQEGGLSYPYQSMIRAAADKHSLPECLLAAVVEVESGFDPRRVSSCGAIGLCQLMPRFHFCEDYEDPEENLDVGAEFLAYCVHRWGIREGLKHYNSGYRRVDNGYAEKVIQRSKYYFMIASRHSSSFHPLALATSIEVGG